MMAETNVQPGFPPRAGNAEISRLQRFLWSVRRELWEFKSIYIAPLVAGAVGVVALLANEAHSHFGVRIPHDTTPYDAAAALVLGTALITAAYYCLESLHGERRDRSILFWKSLPVSDVTTVLAKAAIIGIVLPVVSCAIAFATQLVMLLLDSAIHTATGQSVAVLWREVEPLKGSLDLLYHVMTIHVLWWAPYYGWLMLVSAWARRAPLLWATLPALAIGGVEKIVFNSKHFFDYLQYRFEGPSVPDIPTSAMRMIPMVDLLKFLSVPGLWAGLGFAAACLALAVRLRRYREPI
jgi:ABC-2 type transport system permease protein